MPSALQTPPTTRADSLKAASPRSLWLAVLQFFAALFVVVAILESMFFVAGIGDQEFLRLDPATGYSPMAGKHMVWRKEGFSRTDFNSHGMRDIERPFEKPAGTFRIAFIGDSFVEALQVEREKTFVALMEQMLNSDAGSPAVKVECLNFGVSAYNIGQMYLRLRDLAFRFHPDLVVVCLRSDTTFLLAPDPHGGFIFARPTFFADGNHGFVQDNTIQDLFQKSGEGKRMRNLAWLREHSRIWGVVSTCMEYLVTEYKDDWERLDLSARSFFKSGRFAPPAPPPVRTASHGESGVSASALLGAPAAKPADQATCRKATLFLWPTADALLTAMDRECTAHDARIAFVRLPGPGGQHNLLEASLLKSSATRLGAPYTDLNPPFAARDKTGKNLFFTFHMNEAGHALAAETLAGSLAQQRLVPISRADK